MRFGTFYTWPYVCNDCGVEVKDEWYMVHDEIWESCGLTHGFMCIGCLEKRLGRRLTCDDFKPDVPLNDMSKINGSPRLQDRLKGFVWKPER